MAKRTSGPKVISKKNSNQDSKPPQKQSRSSSKVGTKGSPTKQPQYHLVVVKESNLPECEHYNDFDSLKKRVAELVDQEVWIYIFEGSMGYVSQPPFRFLVVPGIAPCPLFDVPNKEALEASSGYLGSELLISGDEDDELDSEIAKSESDESESESQDGVIDDEDDFFFDDTQT